MKNLVIAISGPPGAGSTTISKIIAKKLKLNYFSFGKLHKEMFVGWESKEARAALEVWKTPAGSSSKTHKERDNLQVIIAKKGNVVICGKLSIHFLKKLTPYKIWVHANQNVRAKRTAQRDKISIKEALEQITKREKFERRSWKKIYGFDYFKQRKEADLAIDSSSLTVNQTVNKILNFIKSRQFFNLK